MAQEKLWLHSRATLHLTCTSKHPRSRIATVPPHKTLVASVMLAVIASNFSSGDCLRFCAAVGTSRAPSARHHADPLPVAQATHHHGLAVSHPSPGRDFVSAQGPKCRLQSMVAVLQSGFKPFLTFVAVAGSLPASLPQYPPDVATAHQMHPARAPAAFLPSPQVPLRI